MSLAHAVLSACLGFLAVGAGLLACTYLDLRAQSLTRAMQGFALRRCIASSACALALTVGAFALALA